MQVVLLQLPLIADEAATKALIKKLGPPLVTLLSEEAEVQYVALRNINLIVQKHPEVLSHEIKARPARAPGDQCCMHAALLGPCSSNHSSSFRSCMLMPQTAP